MMKNDTINSTHAMSATTNRNNPLLILFRLKTMRPIEMNMNPIAPNESHILSKALTLPHPFPIIDRISRRLLAFSFDSLTLPPLPSASLLQTIPNKAPL
mgnify:CR=1 FL=1